jgi:hypothetical protein
MVRLPEQIDGKRARCCALSAEVEALAKYAARASFSDLSAESRNNCQSTF